MEKKCSKCEQVKDLEDFPNCKKRKDGKQRYCSQCNKERLQKYYQDNKDKHLKEAQKRRQDFRKWWNDYKSQFKCQRCPESDPVCIDFHHLNPDEKDSAVSTLISNQNRKKIIEEVEKCIPLCANCHRKEHRFNP